MLATAILLALAWQSRAREVGRIIKKVYLHRSYYYGPKFQKLIEKQFKRFDRSYVMLFKEMDACIHEHHKDPPFCEEHCLGRNFKRVKKRFEMITLRVRSIFDNILSVLFNDNCMNNRDLIETCKSLWDDLLVLDYYGYNINFVVKKNKAKYVDELFTEQEFQRVFGLVERLFEKYYAYMKDRDNVRLVMLGRLYNIIETKTRQYRSADHESILGNPEPIDQEQFGLMFQQKLEAEFKDPTRPIEDPGSSMDDQVQELSLWDMFKGLAKPKKQKEKMTKEEEEEIEQQFNNEVENSTKRADLNRAEYIEEDNPKMAMEVAHKQNEEGEKALDEMRDDVQEEEEDDSERT